MSYLEKVVIIGSPGAGKSTLARKLGKILDIEVIHLDRYFWRSDWHEIPRDERMRIQAELIQRPQWIIEGTYFSSSDDRLQAADTIIYLDLPFWLCLSRVLKRRFEYNNKARPDLPKGCSEKLRLIYLVKVMVFPLRGRILFTEKVEQVLQFREVQLLWFLSTSEVSSFLAHIDERQSSCLKTA